MTRRTRGFTLVELIISMTVLAILGAAAMRTLSTSAKLNEKQEAGQRSRAVARGSLARLASELRAVPVPGPGAPVSMVEFATADSVQARVPYLLALFCGVGAGDLTLSVLPRDTTFGSNADHAGLLVRLPSGQFAWEPTAAPTAGTASVCDGGSGPGVRTLPGGTVIRLAAPPGGTLATLFGTLRPGTAVYLAKRVRYAFAPLDGSIALTRAWYDGAGTRLGREVIATPFATGTQLFYWAGSQVLLPPVLGTDLVRVSGLTLSIRGQSAELVRLGIAPTAEYATSIHFQNRAQ